MHRRGAEILLFEMVRNRDLQPYEDKRNIQVVLKMMSIFDFEAQY